MSEQGTTPPGARPGGAADGPPGPRPAKKAAKAPAKKAAGPRPAPAGATAAGGGDDGPASTTAIALIVATVIIGLLVFAKGVQRDTSVETATTPTTTTAPGATTVDRNAAPTTTRPEQAGTITTPTSTRAPSAVKVYVLNSADPSKTLAGPMATELGNMGYQVVGRNDGPPAATSQVYYAPGFEAEAKALASSIGFGTSSAAPLPANPSFTVPPGSDLVVSIGKDKADDVAAGRFGTGSSGSSSGATTTASGSSTTTTTTR